MVWLGIDLSEHMHEEQARRRRLVNQAPETLVAVKA